MRILQRVTLIVLAAAMPLQYSVGDVSDCLEISRWREFRTTINEASSGDHLVFCPFRITKPDSARVIIRKPVHVSCSQPKQCTIVGKGRHIIVSSTTQDFSVSEFVFVGATENALRFSRTTPLANDYKINDCSFRYNHGTLAKEGRGGAIRVDSGANVTITNTRFLDNQAYQGGAIFVVGGSVYVNSCDFEENLAMRGSSIFVSTRANLVQITATVFLSNALPTGTGGTIHSRFRENVRVLDGTKGANNEGCNGLFDASSKECIPFPDSLVPQTPSIGDLTVRKEGVRFSMGLSARVVARAGEPVVFTSPEAIDDGLTSSIPFHMEPDGAAAFALDDGGYIYVSNSEVRDGQGGVYGLEFDEDGYIRDYKPMLQNNSRNCNGGKTPWETWISCEEVSDGHCWQVDPQGKISPSKTQLGGLEGGNFEAFAYDNRNSSNPQFFVTEDSKDGALRRFRPPPGAASDWSMLHYDEGNILEYLEFLPENKFRWTSSLAAGRASASQYFRNTEGIAHHNDGRLLFVSKVQKELFRLDLDKMTYSVESTETDELEGGGSFGSGPDHLLSTSGGLLYFTEDGGRTPGVFVYDGVQYKAFLEADSPMYEGDETTGIAFSPDRKRLLFCLQEAGVCMQVSRIDGKAFDSNHRILQWKYTLHDR